MGRPSSPRIRAAGCLIRMAPLTVDDAWSSTTVQGR